MKTSRRRERGVVLLAMVAVIMLGASWLLVKQLNAESGGLDAARKLRNAEVLSQAKLALIGYVAQQAAMSVEVNPGAFPCPEAPAGFYSVVGTDGRTQTPSCALPAIGRFPWRTIGTDKLVDASGEPLWYVVASGWAKPGPAATDYTIINSNCTDAASAMDCWTGQLTVDGQANAAVALIFAPGPTIRKIAGGGCAAGYQARPQGLDPNWCDYLEGENATNPADATFVTTGPSGSFNDQVVRITVADIMPAIEAAIAQRIEREIVPALNSVYPASAAHPTSGWVLSATTRSIYPYAAPFASPGPGAGTSSFLGVAANYQGLLPFNQTECVAAAGNPRCLPALITWRGTPANSVEVFGFGYIGPGAQTCSWQSGGEVRECTGNYHEHDGTSGPTTVDESLPIRIEMTARFNNVAMGLRAIDTTKMTVEARDDTCAPGCPWEPQAVTYTATMRTDGSATITFGATLPNINVKIWGTYALFRIRIDRTAVADHVLLDTADATTGWFARNEWFRQVYYAVSPAYATGNTTFPTLLRLPPTCTTGATGVAANDCLSVANLPNPPYTPNAQRAILILAGRSINGSARPSLTLGNYLEFGNATATGTAALPYERRPVSKVTNPALKSPFNDRILVIGSN